MKTHVFFRLALTGIIKNRKLYIPYIVSCTGSVLMYYIISFLSLSETVGSVGGGSNLQLIFGMGKFVIVAFALIFLMYTNSFLNRRRNKEFGLYNILGMDKSGIIKVLLCESLITAAVSIVTGLVSGIVFSKLGELALLNFIHSSITYNLSVSWVSAEYTVELFAAIFLVLFVKSVIQVGRADALELMNSEKAGEKAPKANYVIALAGAVILAAAYYMSLTIKSPLDAIFSFLIAVIMVIVATYLLFIAGSVTMCRLLQKNPKYYYKKNHFVSVSSMAYRMKRNGAGLASICILSTMVLVMIASSASLYFGADDSIKAKYSQDNFIGAYISVNDADEEHISMIKNGYEKVFAEKNVTPLNTVEYRYSSITGLDGDSGIDPDVSGYVSTLSIPDKLRGIIFMPRSDYNRVTGESISLKENEAMVYTLRCTYDKDKFTMGDVCLTVKGHLDSFPAISDSNVSMIPTVFIVIPDMKTIAPLEKLADCNGDRMLETEWYFGYDLDTDDSMKKEVFSAQLATLDGLDFLGNGVGYTNTSGCLPTGKDDFYSTFGGLFFIGIMLSVIFIFAETMIIYYKQVSEGYEDQSGFAIMQNVGMTKTDIKKSINSQTVTVFFAPLIGAGIHLCFAFPPIWKLLQCFNLNNLPLVVLVTLCAFVLFGVFYSVIYKITAKAYYSIVVSAE